MNSINRFAPSFTSKIKFVPKEEYNKHINPKYYIGNPWKVDQTIIGTEGNSDDSGPCQIGGINNSDKMLFYHFNSCMSDFMPQEDLLKSKLDEIKPDERGIRGLMSGGIFAKYTEFSIRMLKKIYPIFKEKVGQNLSIIWGQCENRCTNAGYNVKEDTWYINSENNGLDQDALFSVDDLNKTYSFIHIADGDEVYINGKHIDKSEIKQTSYEEIEAKIAQI